jgi:hypothetical protein
MALVEAAVVIHLRGLYYPQDRLAIFPLQLLSDADLWLELAREAATVVMLAAVAVLTEKGAVRVFAAFVYDFGLWDLFYYFWLKLFLGWPVSWSEWDVLFLIPWPWLGPWIAPAAIAVLFVGWGGAVLIDVRRRDFPRLSLALFVVGALAALTAFLQPGWALLAQGRDAWQGYMPGRFWWEVFATGYLSMAAGLLNTLRPSLESTQRPRRRRVRGAKRFRV